MTEIAAAGGRTRRSTPIPLEAFVAATPEELRELVGFLFGDLLDGRNAEPQDGVFRALGRAPRDFGEFARREAGAWA